jgi:uncharacterized protein (TIGR03437 family)
MSRSNFRLLLPVAALSLFLNTPGVSQSASGFSGTVPAGLAPLGVAITLVPPTIGPSPDVYAAIANSGDNSVSVLRLSSGTTGFVTVTAMSKIEGIPSPYAVAACPSNAAVLVSSPSDNSVRLLQLPAGTATRILQVGPQPHSVACSGASSGSGGVWMVVSNQGDNTLTVVNGLSGAPVTIPNVPASTAFHGIAVTSNASNQAVAWIAGTSANVVTLVNLTTSSVVGQIPIASPTAVMTNAQGSIFVASAQENEVFVYGTTLQATPFEAVSAPQDATMTSFFSVAAIQGGLGPIFPNSVSGGAAVPGSSSLAWSSFAPILLPPSPYTVDGQYFYPWILMVTSTSLNSVFFYEPTDQYTPMGFQIANAASFATNASAPGSLASLFIATSVSNNFSASSAALPTALGGVSLSVSAMISSYTSAGAVPVPLLFVGPTQINFQVPPVIATEQPWMQLTKADGSTVQAQVSLPLTAPGIFTVSQNGTGQGAVLNADYSQNGAPGSTAGANPAPRGGVIEIFTTGAGATTPTLQPGAAAPVSGNPLVFTNAQPTVTIGGIAAQVLFSGMAPGFVGLWQINAVVPQSVTPGSAVSLVVSAGGVTSNTVTIAVQ